jgi:hypothetical protein
MPTALTVWEGTVLLSPIIIAFIGTGIIIWKTPNANDLEIIKARFASVTFTGILVLFIFTALLYFLRPETGREIFDRATTGMTPLAGAIVGYLFSSNGRRARRERDVGDAKGGDTNTADTGRGS